MEAIVIHGGKLNYIVTIIIDHHAMLTYILHAYNMLFKLIAESTDSLGWLFTCHVQPTIQLKQCITSSWMQSKHTQFHHGFELTSVVKTLMLLVLCSLIVEQAVGVSLPVVQFIIKGSRDYGVT